MTEKMLEEFPEAVEEMEKGLKYTFTALCKNNASSMRSRGWENAFGTSDNKQEAERRIKALEMEVEWLLDAGLKTIIGPRPLTKVFAGRKGRRKWFNTTVGMHGKEINSAAMANGTEIQSDMLKRCGEIIEEKGIQFKWEKGDVLFFDEMALLHGRRPSLPPRKVS